MEDTAGSCLTFNPYLAAHHLGEFFADSQTKPGTAILAGGGGICLAKGLKQFLLLCRRQANPCITNSKVQFGGFFILLQHCNAYNDLSLFGKLHCIVAEIDQHLPQAQGIADKGGRKFSRQVKHQFQTLFFRLEPDQVGEMIKDILQSEVSLFHRKLAGLDFGKIKDIINNTKKCLTGTMDLLNIIFLPGIEIGLQGQVRHTDDGVHRCTDLVAHICKKV